MASLKPEEVYGWCEQLSKDSECCFVLCGELHEVSYEEVTKIIADRTGMRRPNVLGRRDDAVMLESNAVLERGLIPAVFSYEGSKRWSIVLPLKPSEEMRAAQESSPTEERARSLIVQSPDIQRQDDSPLGLDGTSDTQSQLFLIAMTKLVEQLGRNQHDGEYRILRPFSGVQPVPTGEDAYEVWKDTAIQYMEEWHCPETAKRQRIVESLRGPAMEIVQATRRSDPKATAQNYLAALEREFGTLEDATDLLYKLINTCQEPGERLSKYLYRLDKLIYRIVEKGGMTLSEVDERRMQQLLRGALSLYPVALKLREDSTRKPAPSFNQLINEVKQEEAIIEARDSVVKKIKTVSLKQETSTKEEELLKILQVQKEQIDRPLALQTAREVPRPLYSSSPIQLESRGDPRRCFECGRPGHIARQCPSRWHQRSSYKQSPQLEQPSGNEKGGPEDPTLAP
ncbi:paraneoplastic antigen Ma1 homolog [Pseudophryne corroboree]|uniref:paraneoplastic antigen Ma1 homolog n=1 Tax=Pseudophryne corroboree TaxID=495146 RepID=UPI003082153F